MSVTWWIFVIISVAVAFLPQLIANRYTWYTQDELAKKFNNYENINLSCMGYFIVFMAVAALMIFLLDRFGDPNNKYFPIIFPVWIAVTFSSLGITYGLFAARKGVYPVSKYRFGRTTYAYSEGDQVVRLGRIQVIVSIIYLLVTIFATLIRLYFLVDGL